MEIVKTGLVGLVTMAVMAGVVWVFLLSPAAPYLMGVLVAVMVIGLAFGVGHAARELWGQRRG